MATAMQAECERLYRAALPDGEHSRAHLIADRLAATPEGQRLAAAGFKLYVACSDDNSDFCGRGTLSVEWCGPDCISVFWRADDGLWESIRPYRGYDPLRRADSTGPVDFEAAYAHATAGES